MLDTMLVVAGCLVVLGVFVDAFMTTLAVSAGAGPLTSVVLGACWRLFLRFHQQDKESSFLTAAGTVLLGATVLTWVAVLWAGWSLVFLGSDSVVEARTREPAGVADVVYYTGFTVFTLGTGDFVASTPAWRVVTAAASFLGLFLVTLAITYLVSVVSAVVTKRSLAIQVHGLGGSAGQIVTRGWTGAGFGGMFQQQLVSLTPTVAVSAEQHLAYPVLHYFHSSTRRLAAALAVAKLDDALLVLTEGVAPQCRPERDTVEPLRFALGRYLATATVPSWAPEVGPPPPPSLAELAAAGIPIVEPAAMDAAVESASERRNDLHRLVASDGWSWEGPR